MIALLAMRVSELRPYVPPEVQTGLRRSLRVMLSFVRRSRRVARRVLRGARAEHDLVQLRRAAAAARRARRSTRTRDVFGLIAAVFGAGALCGALFLATLGKARIRLLLAGALGFGVLELALAPQTSLAGRSASCSS